MPDVVNKHDARSRQRAYAYVLYVFSYLLRSKKEKRQRAELNHRQTAPCRLMADHVAFVRQACNSLCAFCNCTPGQHSDVLILIFVRHWVFSTVLASWVWLRRFYLSCTGSQHTRVGAWDTIKVTSYNGTPPSPINTTVLGVRHQTVTSREGGVSNLLVLLRCRNPNTGFVIGSGLN
jgi:hypothetical protein